MSLLMRSLARHTNYTPRRTCTCKQVRSKTETCNHSQSNSEDFGLSNARRLLDKYSSKLACFNDDVQGTGCITLAAIMAGLHVSKVEMKDMRLVIFGSGTAGMGIADQIRDAIATESDKSPEEAAKQIW